MMWRRDVSRRHITNRVSGRSGTGTAEGGRQESVVDQILVGRRVRAGVARVREELLQVLRDVIRGIRPSDDVEHGPDERRGESPIDLRVRTCANGWRDPVDLVKDHLAVGVAAKLVLGSCRMACRAPGAGFVGALGRVELLRDEPADRVREDSVRALKNGASTTVLLGCAVHTATWPGNVQADRL